MTILRDQMELANMSPPPSNFLEKAILEGQHLEGQSPDRGVRIHEYCINTTSATGSPATCSTSSPGNPNIYMSETGMPVTAQ